MTNLEKRNICVLQITVPTDPTCNYQYLCRGVTFNFYLESVIIYFTHTPK